MPQRRNFLKMTGLLGAGLLSDFTNPVWGSPDVPAFQTPDRRGTDSFNMSGFAAPKLDTVRIGIVGLGNRGPAAVERLALIEGVEIKALCDIRPEKANAVKAKLAGSVHQPKLYTENGESWKKMCDQQDLDLIYITTPWALHTPIATYAM